MYERFTDRARKVMQLANQEAQRFNHEYIGTEHILLGLVKEGSGVAANVLKNLDVDLRKIRLEVEKLVQSGPEMVTIGKLPQTPRAKKVIEYSMEEARNLNHNYVGTEHILLGLLREQEGVAAQVLMNLGLKLDDVREEVLNLLGGCEPIATVTATTNERLTDLKPVHKIHSQMQPIDRKTFYQRWSWPLLLLTVLATPYAFYTAIRAVRSNENHVEDWLPKAFDETQKLAWFRKHFASDQFVIISWEGCRLGLAEGEQDDPRLQTLTSMLTVRPNPDPAAELEQQPQDGDLSDAESKSSPVAQLQVSPQDRAIIERCIKTVETGRTVLNKLTAEPLSLSVKEAVRRLKGVMIGPDGRQTCLIVTLKPAALKELKSVVGNGRKRLVGADVPMGLLPRMIKEIGLTSAEVHMGGPPVDNTAIDEEGERTLIRLAGLSGLLGIGLAWWSLRNVALTAIVFMCGVLSAATSLGTVWLTGQNVDAILMSMPSLVYVLAISGAIHLVSYYREAVEENGMYGAAEKAVSLAWKPALLCTITTAIGLLSLAVSELVPIKKFGIYSAIGVVDLVVIVYLVVPAALQVTGAGKRWVRPKSKRSSTQADDRPGQDLEHSFWFRYAKFTIRHYRVVGFLSILLTAVVGFGLYFAKSSIDLLKLFDHRARILQDYRWLEANLGKLVPLEIVLVFPDHWQAQPTNQTTDAAMAPLTFVQRMEIVSQLQAIIEQRFGAQGDEIVGQSLSAAAFAPKLPSEKSGMRAIVYRTAINKRLTADKQSLIDTGFLRIDDEDNSELWRISLRVAAFNDVDYGTFTRELQAVAQPLIDACYLRSKVLTELQARSQPSENSERQKVLLWGHFKDDVSRTQKEQVVSLLVSQLQQLAIDVVVEKRPPAEVPISGLNRLKEYDSIVAFGDFTDNDMRLTRSVMPKLILAKASEMPTMPRTNIGKPTSAEDAQPVELSAIYTGVVPIVYQAQRALLNSLSESTFWSFLTITPIMMFVSRSVLAGAVAMIPNLVPILLVFGGMGWMGVAVDIGSLMTASIALGVAVDDTIHFLARFREELDHREDRFESIAAAYCHCAVPTLQAATISGLGLSVFAFSTFAPTQKFGWLMLSILFAGVVAELVLLPALLASPLGKCFIHKKKLPEVAPESNQLAA